MHSYMHAKREAVKPAQEIFKLGHVQRARQTLVRSATREDALLRLPPAPLLQFHSHRGMCGYLSRWAEREAQPVTEKHTEACSRVVGVRRRVFKADLIRRIQHLKEKPDNRANDSGCPCWLPSKSSIFDLDCSE